MRPDILLHSSTQRGEIKSKLKRDLTPRTKDFLSMHKDAYQAALEPCESVKDREGCLREVQTFDKIYCSHAFLYRTIPTQEMEGLIAIRKVREYEILARYGDYLGQEVQDFRTNVYADLRVQGRKALKLPR